MIELAGGFVPPDKIGSAGGGGAPASMFDTVTVTNLLGASFTVFGAVDLGPLGQNTYAMLHTEHQLYTITGFVGGVDGKIVCIQSSHDYGGGNDFSISYNDAGELAANRVLTTGGAALTVNSAGAVWLRYDGGVSRWRVFARCQ